jgi:sugar phosphate isomerase/epimerase
MSHTSIYIGTVLLEANRWARQRTPTFLVSDWLPRLAAAGFDGIELWENHVTLAPASERAALRAAPLPVRVFNSYATMNAAGAAARDLAAALALELRAGAVKFNVGKDSASLIEELEAARCWGRQMPGVQLLCECHPGTALEHPERAAEALASFPEVSVIVHAFTSADLQGWFRHLGPRVRHTHVQILDPNGRRCKLRDQTPLVRERLAAMRAAGYSGSFTIEFTAGVGTAPEDREALFAAACDDLAFLREEW